MIEPNGDLKSLIECLVHDEAVDAAKGRSQLIRILSRSSTLPKLDNIQIHSSTSNPNSFFIKHGHSLNIGINLLSDPVTTLFCLRYGIEWQIWYNAQPKDDLNPRICDVAACKVVARFYELNHLEEKEAIKKISTPIADIILKFRSPEDATPELTENEFKILGKLHNLRYPNTQIHKESIKIINSLANPTESLLMSGGDLRLNIDPNQLLNVYGCRPFPRPEAYTFASSTATSVSNVAFNRTEIQRESLIKKCFKNGSNESFQTFSKEIKSKLKGFLSLPESSTLILAPSGTDVYLQFAGICEAVFRSGVVHILVASDETGGSVSLALHGKHFSEQTALGIKITKEKLIDGFSKSEVENVPLRNREGILNDGKFLEGQISAIVNKVIQEGKQPVLHVMDQSKLGYSAPSMDCILKLQQLFGDKLIVMVDNSQLRMDKREIRNYIKAGFLMAITGSKFFTGPPFSGALIIPKELSEKWSGVAIPLPNGLKEYFYKNEWPDNWLMSNNLQIGNNIGASMRWSAAIEEIERYFRTPLYLRSLGSEMFCKHVKKMIEEAEFLEHLSKSFSNEDVSKYSFRGSHNRSIFPFFIRFKKRVLTAMEVNKIYHLLNSNLSNGLRGSDEQSRLAKQACHIGQPVKVVYSDGTQTGVLRISLGSRVISESWKDQDVSLFFQKIEEQMTQVTVIIRKIKLILDHPEWLLD